MSNYERAEFDPLMISANRINSYTSCGKAFKREYIDREPVQRSGSAALFGSVIHVALEHWSLDRKGSSLRDHVVTAWATVTKEDVAGEFISAFAALAPELQVATDECVSAFESRTGKPSKAIRMSGEWKRHPMAKKLDLFMQAWNAKLRRSYWRFSENDPLPSLYAESLSLADKYEARMFNEPNVWATESSFTIPFQGNFLNGYIDSLEPVVRAGKVRAIGVKDYKTYAREPADQKDWRQRVIYWQAVTFMLEHQPEDTGIPQEYWHLPVYVGMDYVRWTPDWEVPSVDWFSVCEADLQLLREDIDAYKAGVASGVFLPAQKNQNPDWCNYPGTCCLQCKPNGAGQRVKL